MMHQSGDVDGVRTLLGETMGIDLLDFNMRIEKLFGAELPMRDVPPFLTGKKKEEITAGDLHRWVVHLCETKGMKVPPSSWSRVRLALAKVVKKPPRQIRPETLIVRDLGFC